MIAFEKSAGAVVFRLSDEGIKYLLLHYISGHWDFPKGHIESGESETAALEREVSEETGIKQLDILPNFRSSIRYFYRAKDKEKERRRKEGHSLNVFKKVVYYLAETNESAVRISAEHIGCEWLVYGDAMERITFQNGKRILKKAQCFLAMVAKNNNSV